jgi:hypothetical protein
MKKACVALAVASVFALSACGNPTTADDEINNDPIPGEEQPLPGDENLDDDLNDDMDDDLEDDTEG